MSIACIIVNYKTGPLIIEHLPKIRAELGSVAGSHIYIVDNQSPTGDAQLLGSACEGMDDVTVIAAERNGGFSYGNNRGFERALADREGKDGFDHFYLLNPDAYPRPGCISTLLGFLDENPQVGIVGSKLEGEDGEAQRSAFRFMSLASELTGAASFGPISKLFANKLVAPPVRDEAHKADWVCGASMLMRADVLEKVGMMDETYFLYFEEVDYQRAAWDAGFEVWYEPAARAVHLVGQSTDMKHSKQSSGKAPDYWYDSRRYYFRKNHGAGFATMADAAWSAGKVINGLKGLLKGQSPVHPLGDIAGLRAAGRRARS